MTTTSAPAHPDFFGATVPLGELSKEGATRLLGDRIIPAAPVDPMDDWLLGGGARMSDADIAGFLAQDAGFSVHPDMGGVGDTGDLDSDAAFKAREDARQKEKDTLFSRLNPRQAEAVQLPKDASVLVLAGAGSGKTSVLTARIAHLIANGTPAREILAVTFTNKASEEMKVRLKKLMDKRTVGELMVGTFHSLCSKILRDNHVAAGLPKAFAILDTDGQEAICRMALKDLGLTKSSVKAAAKAKAAVATADLLTMADPLAGFAEARDTSDDYADDESVNEYVTPAQCAKYISSHKEAGESPAPVAAITTRSTDTEQMEAVFAIYQDQCAKSGLLDFQDLLTKTVDLLEKDSTVRNTYRERLSSILVDEFQDTNDIQYRWLELIKGSRTHVMAVGDDYQSIYAFRGANPKNMFRFLKEMATDSRAPTGRIVKLEQNYRSLPHILEAANAIIARNENQMAKTLFTTHADKGERIDLVTFGNGLFEAGAIARSIHSFIKERQVPPSELAVLYRTNQQSRMIESELTKLGVPLTVYGGFRFYERQEVKNVLAYMDLVTDMTRDLSFSRVANFPPRGLGERTVEELRQSAKERGVSMMEMVGVRSAVMAENPSAMGNLSAQKKQRQLESFAAIILDAAEFALDHPLHKVIEKLIDTSGLKTHYLSEATGSRASKEETEERVANISELVSAARQFEIENPHLQGATEQLPEYMAHVALMTSTSESDMSRKNTVSLMTVHSAKGLEFDHVFIAGLDESIFPHSRAIKEDADRSVVSEDYDETADNTGRAGRDGEGMQEERRLMYVAVTRARKTLTLTHALQRMVNGETKSYEPSRFLDEIPDSRLNRIDDNEVRFGAPQKPWGARGYGNHEYGGDAFDETRDARVESRLHTPKDAPKYAPKSNSPKPMAPQPVTSAPVRAPALPPASPAPPASTSPRKLAIIGTAGRDKDKPMSLMLWDAMVADARTRVKPNDTLISGGAAWADHLAVKLFLSGSVKRLVLRLPAPMEEGLYTGPERNSAGAAANYYHGLFKRITGVDGLAEIEAAIRKGAEVTYEPAAPGYGAMYARNKKVADGCNAMLAYTFCGDGVPNDGGTRDTWDKSKSSQKTHVNLENLEKQVNLRKSANPNPEAAPVALAVSAPMNSAPKPWDKPWLRNTTPTSAPGTLPGAQSSASAILGGAAVRTGPSEAVRSRLINMGRQPSAPRPR